MYEGEFKNNKMHGTGQLYYDDGQYFIGQFDKGKKNGQGEEYN